MTVSSAVRAVTTFAVVFVVCAAARPTADEPAVTLRASRVGTPAPGNTMRIELFRWSSEAERAPLLAAVAAMNRPPAPPPAPDAAPAAGRGGRAGRGGARGRGAAAPPSPLAQMSSAIKAAPTVGFVWGEGVTGYSVKYAWRAAQPDGGERIVLVTDRRLGGAADAALPAATDPEFTVIEVRLDGKGSGEAKSSLTARVVVDAVAQTLALDGYAAAPPLLKVMR
jgi:hypothetical protein